MTDHLTLLVAPDTPPAKRILLAKHLLQSTGWLWDDAVDALEKATGTVRRRRGASMVSDEAHTLSTPALETLWQHLDAWGQQWPALLLHQLQLLIEGHDVGLHKALGRAWHVPWLAEQWAIFRETMTALSHQVLRWLTSREALAPEEVARLHLPAVVQDVFGQAVQEGMAHTLPLTATEQAAIDYARQHAGAQLRPVFTGFEARLEARVLDVERQRVREAVGTALRLRQAPPRLASVLGDMTGQWQRDWARVARTELQEAHNQGAVAALIARHPSNVRNGQPVAEPRVPDVQVHRIPSASACQTCLRLYLREDRSPRLYFLRDLLANGSNEGRRTEEYLPVVGATHPNCTCSPPLEYTGMAEITFERIRKERRHE